MLLLVLAVSGVTLASAALPCAGIVFNIDRAFRAIGCGRWRQLRVLGWNPQFECPLCSYPKTAFTAEHFRLTNIRSTVLESNTTLSLVGSS